MDSSGSIRSGAYVATYFGLWAAAFLLLRNLYRFQASEALAAFVVLGLILPALSLLTTSHISALPHVVRRPALETTVLLAYLAIIAIVLVWGFGSVARIATEPLHSIVLLGVKLAAIAVVPGAMLLRLGRYRIRELAPVSLRWTELRPAVWMSLAFLLI